MKEYRFQYKFTAGTEEYPLPKEVMELLPTDKTYYKPGTKITSIQLEKTSVNADSGIWKFKGYDTDTKEAVSGVTFTGTWERSEYATLTISNTVAGKYGDKNKKILDRDYTDRSLPEVLLVVLSRLVEIIKMIRLLLIAAGKQLFNYRTENLLQ